METQREAVTITTTIDVPVRRTVRPQPRQRFETSLAVCVGLLLAVSTLLIFIAVSRSPAPASTGHRIGTPIIVPSPTPGPFGS
jgi:hypothetical protein